MTDDDKKSTYQPYNMTQEEVAEILGITRNKVDSIERNAIRKLKYILKRLKKINRSDLF
jgi:DNA-directed RNA polymerase sigma subunit (sigma70/sigma32)